MDGAWKRLHPAAVVVNLVPRTWRVVRSLWPLALALVWRGSLDDASTALAGLIDILLVSVFFLLTVGGTVVHWATLRYRVRSDQLEIQSGLIRRQERVIDPARIQNIEIVQTLIHRAVGLVEVRIETASGSEVEGMLSGLTVSEAEALRHTLEHHRADRALPGMSPSSDEPPLLANSMAELVAFGATSGRFTAAIAILGVITEAWTWTEMASDPSKAGEVLSLPGALQAIAIGLAIVAGAWLLGIGAALVRHWNFRLDYQDEGLIVQGGLTTRRRLEIPLRKVQIVRVSESMVRRWIGYGTFTLESAAPRTGEGGTERRAAMAPWVSKGQLPALSELVIPGLDIDPWQTTLRLPHRKALSRALSRSTVQVLILTAVIWALAFPYAWLTLAAIPVALGLAWLHWRHQGWKITPHVVVARRGYFNQQTTVVSRHRIQSVGLSQGIILRALGLGRVRVRVAGNGVNLPLMAWDEATEIARKLADIRRAQTQDTVCIPERDEAAEE